MPLWAPARPSASSFVDRVLDLLVRMMQVRQVVFFAPAEALFVRIKIAVLLGVFLGLPVILYQLWMFIAVGLTQTERRVVMMLLLARMGLVSPATLAGTRRYAILLIVILAAVLTPGTDVISQLLMAVPTYALYELSIWLARLVAPRPSSYVEPVVE
ncbi:MAG: twin-arginine translocase subunit TatC [Armatimonadota bacterium]|nr:twin-arginine translocase subunit TatC [Armatimonadota bacterium]